MWRITLVQSVDRQPPHAQDHRVGLGMWWETYVAHCGKSKCGHSTTACPRSPCGSRQRLHFPWEEGVRTGLKHVLKSPM